MVKDFILTRPRGLCSNGTEIPVTKPIIYQLNHNLLVCKDCRFISITSSIKLKG